MTPVPCEDSASTALSYRIAQASETIPQLLPSCAMSTTNQNREAEVAVLWQNGLCKSRWSSMELSSSSTGYGVDYSATRIHCIHRSSSKSRRSVRAGKASHQHPDWPAPASLCQGLVPPQQQLLTQEYEICVKTKWILHASVSKKNPFFNSPNRFLAPAMDSSPSHGNLPPIGIRFGVKQAKSRQKGAFASWPVTQHLAQCPV